MKKITITEKEYNELDPEKKDIHHAFFGVRKDLLGNRTMLVYNGYGYSNYIESYNLTITA